MQRLVLAISNGPCTVHCQNCRNFNTIRSAIAFVPIDNGNGCDGSINSLTAARHSLLYILYTIVRTLPTDTDGVHREAKECETRA